MEVSPRRPVMIPNFSPRVVEMQVRSDSCSEIGVSGLGNFFEGKRRPTALSKFDDMHHASLASGWCNS